MITPAAWFAGAQDSQRHGYPGAHDARRRKACPRLAGGPGARHWRLRISSLSPVLPSLGAARMDFIGEAVLHSAGQWWIYQLLLIYFFNDGFAMVVPTPARRIASLSAEA